LVQAGRRMSSAELHSRAWPSRRSPIVLPFSSTTATAAVTSSSEMMWAKNALGLDLCGDGLAIIKGTRAAKVVPLLIAHRQGGILMTEPEDPRMAISARICVLLESLHIVPEWRNRTLPFAYDLAMLAFDTFLVLKGQAWPAGTEKTVSALSRLIKKIE